MMHGNMHTQAACDVRAGAWRGLLACYTSWGDGQSGGWKVSLVRGSMKGIDG